MYTPITSSKAIILFCQSGLKELEIWYSQIAQSWIATGIFLHINENFLFKLHQYIFIVISLFFKNHIMHFFRTTHHLWFAELLEWNKDLFRLLFHILHISCKGIGICFRNGNILSSCELEIPKHHQYITVIKINV